MKPKAITFDFWRTLFRDSDGELRNELRVRAFMDASGAPEDAVRRAFEVWPAEFARVHMEEQRTLTPHDAVRMVCETLDVRLAQEAADTVARAFSEAILEYPAVPIDGALEAVRAAAARVPVAVISDTAISTGRCLRQLLKRFDFATSFATTTFSDEVGVSKPQRAMFERTASALGVEPAALLHIGDLEPTDVVGVHGVGGTAGLFTADNARFLGNTQAEYTFTTWGEFIDRLPELVQTG
ncbi:MAG TPA: HAD family hydrolase [Candidatus Hydrogenedentes bacterium]|nr:HAD family hydrolase [Candidatus Hydrogenedentota bacterium]HNT89590.1 HAD family hydrolase [Candidatus Hydrogenedentota bacterium]